MASIGGIIKGAVGGVLGWGKDTVEGLLGRAEDVVKGVYEFVVHLANYLGQLVDTVGTAWGDMLDAGRWLGRTLAEIVQATWTAAAWTVRHLIPATLRHALRVAGRLATHALAAALDAAKGALADALAFTRTLVAASRRYVLAALGRALDGLRAEIRAAVRAGVTVADWVAHPAHLAEWLVPHLLGPVLRFARSKERALARWLLKAAVPVILAAAHEIETVIADVL